MRATRLKLIGSWARFIATLYVIGYMDTFFVPPEPWWLFPTGVVAGIWLLYAGWWLVRDLGFVDLIKGTANLGGGKVVRWRASRNRAS